MSNLRFYQDLCCWLPLRAELADAVSRVVMRIWRKAVT
jgi:hypothetical protein